MTIFLLLVAVAVLGGAVAVGLGRVRGGLDQPVTSRPYRPLPEAQVMPEDLDAVRFSLGLRGYRMDEVDTVLNRCAGALADRDEEIRRLRRHLAAVQDQAAQDQAVQDQAVQDQAAQDPAAQDRGSPDREGTGG